MQAINELELELGVRTKVDILNKNNLITLRWKAIPINHNVPGNKNADMLVKMFIRGL